jgi:GxxExxY protein
MEAKRFKGWHCRFCDFPVNLDVICLDLVVDGKVVAEIKAVECIHESHAAVALAYLKATQQ